MRSLCCFVSKKTTEISFVISVAGVMFQDQRGASGKNSLYLLSSNISVFMEIVKGKAFYWLR
jgi:hypothetical protein